MLVNGERALAYIVTIDEIREIPNYDRVEQARTNGWWCIVHKGDFNVGDKAIYFEVDSLCPCNDKRFAFLEPKKYRIKTQRMCKTVSQGLLMPLYEFPELKNCNVGDDVTKTLGVAYYVAEDNTRKAKNGNPNEKYNRMAARHPKLAKKSWFRWFMKRSWGRKLLFVFLGQNKDNPKKWPEWIKRTDEERCLIGDTKIITDNGILRIADIVNKELDVKVKSYNEVTGEIEYKDIKSYQKYDCDNDLIEIEYPYRGKSFRKNRIVCTPDHKFFVDGEYVKACDLHVGDCVNMALDCYDDNAIQVIYGMLLGDSNVVVDKRCKSNNIRIKMCHGEKQIDYLKLKMDMFGVNNIYTGKSGYCNNNVYSASINSDANIANHVLNDCYINGNKTVTQSMVDKMTPLSLAMWYLDDGSIKHRSPEDSHNPTIMLSTCAYNEEENMLLINMLRNKFGVEANLRKEKDKYWSIYITVNGTKVFMDLIKDYIPNTMKYKALVEHENLPCKLYGMSFKRKPMIVPVAISDIHKYDNNRNYRYVYDIEVEDNHNFFANNVLVHNCENMPWVLENKNPFVVTEKIDGTSTTVFLDTTTRKPDFGVCSRNVRQMDRDQENYHSSDSVGNVYWEMADKYSMHDALTDIAKKYDVKRVVLQGETYGESIQSNPYKLDERCFAAFNLIFDGERLGSLKAKYILDEYKIPFVPIIAEDYIMPDDFEEFKLEADGNSVINHRCLREGFVYRSQDGKLSFKNVSRRFLLKKKD